MFMRIRKTQVLTVDRSSKRSMPAMTASQVSWTTSSALAPVRTNVAATRRSDVSWRSSNQRERGLVPSPQRGHELTLVAEVDGRSGHERPW